MADIKLNLVNQALSAAGEDTISALTGTGFLPRAAIENYDQFVEDALEEGTWKFAAKTGEPTLLTATSDEPLQYRWQIPAEAIRVVAVLYLGVVLDGEFFEIEGRVVRAQYDTDVTIKYIYRPDEGTWPARFRRIIVQKLEALFLRATERHTEAVARDKDTDIRTMRAKHAEASQRRNRPMGEGSLIERRRSAGRRG